VLIRNVRINSSDVIWYFVLSFSYQIGNVGINTKVNTVISSVHVDD